MRSLITILFVATLLSAMDFKSVKVDEAELLQRGDTKLYCPNCGMNLPKFYKTNHVAKLKSGEVFQFCSIYCLVESFEYGDNRSKESQIDKIMVVDTVSNRFIDVDRAYYVVGSKVKGTMTQVSKFAFKSLKDAREFSSKNGGEIVKFQDALEVAKSDFAKDTEMVQRMRGSKMYKKGEIIYKTLCDREKLSKLHFHNIGELKALVGDSRVCGDLKNDMQKQALALYYWDIKLDRFTKLKNQRSGSSVLDSYSKKEQAPIEVKKYDKCPVCGMFVAKYPNWVAKVELANSEYRVFDGAKDMFKYYFDSREYERKSVKIESLSVTDYYRVIELDAKKSYYVIGSNIYGPMGNELIPFKRRDEAIKFSKMHAGKRVLSFDEVDRALIDSLDKK